MSIVFGDVEISSTVSGIGTSERTSVRVATTSNAALATAYASGQTVDGISLVSGNRILIKNQTSASENGIYIVQSSGTPVRSVDLSEGSSAANIAVFVQEGTANADTGWLCITDRGSDTVNVDPITFNKFTGDVDGPGSSTDNAIVRWDGATGQHIQNSGVLIDDSNNISGAVNYTSTGYIQLSDIAAPANPADTEGRLYKLTGNDGIWWKPDSAGTAVDLTNHSIRVKEEGSDITGTPHGILDFIGTRITAANAGGGRATVTVAMPTTTKGDLMVHNGTDDTRLAVGTDNYVLSADSAQSTGLRWRPFNGKLAEDLQGVTSTTLASTSSQTFVDMPGMTITASNSGTADYLVIFSQTAYTSNASSSNTYNIILNVNGSDVVVTERIERPVNSNSDFVITTSHYITGIANGQVVKIRWKAIGNMTIYAKNRELSIAGFSSFS